MGKRKASKKPARKWKQEKLCPFCYHESSVECRMDRKDLIGRAVCSICNESFHTTINDTNSSHLYSEWIDQCEHVNTAEA